MKRQLSQEIQVGIMVVIGIVILVAGVMFFKRVNLRTDMKTYAVDIPAVEGLRPGDRVQVRGIRVGQVSGFEFMPERVRVFVEIEDWIVLTEDSEVTLIMKGLVGEVLLEIEPGSGDPVPPGHVFSGRSAASMLALGDKVNEVLEVMSDLGSEMSRLISDLRDQDSLLGSLVAAERTLTETGEVLQENRADLRRLTGALAQLTETLQAALGEGKLDSTLMLTRHAVASVDTAMVELRAAASQGRALLAGVQRGDGALGRLVVDDTLYDRADSTLHSLERLLDQMRRDPKAVFKMSLF